MSKAEQRDTELELQLEQKSGYQTHKMTQNTDSTQPALKFFGHIAPELKETCELSFRGCKTF